MDVLKDNLFHELLYAIRTVVAGGRYISPLIAADMLDYMNRNEQKECVLTKREKEILSLITKGMRNREIADKLFISKRTVDTHRARIMQKLDIHGSANLVKYAIKMGLDGVEGEKS